MQGLRSFFRRGAGLALQAKLEHLLGQDITNLDDEILQLRQLRAPLGSLRPPDAVGKVFGHALDVGADFIYFGAPLFVACHPWLLIEVAAIRPTSLRRESTTPLSCHANQVLHPRGSVHPDSSGHHFLALAQYSLAQTTVPVFRGSPPPRAAT